LSAKRGDDERASEREADGKFLRHDHHDGQGEREGDEDEEDAGGEEGAEVHERLPSSSCIIGEREGWGGGVGSRP
jgi:hypothetical protein